MAKRNKVLSEFLNLTTPIRYDWSTALLWDLTEREVIHHACAEKYASVLKKRDSNFKVDAYWHGEHMECPFCSNPIKSEYGE